MNRRDFAKGLAALPFARLSYAIGPGCTNTTLCNPIAGSFLVWLEGPFAITIKQDGSGIKVFSPIDADHLILFNGLGQPGSFPQQYHFNLKGVVNSESICISPDLNDLCVDHLGKALGNLDNAFVRIDLPRPANVYTSKRLQGTLGVGANRRLVCAPQDHILEYKKNTSMPQVTYEDTSTTVNTSADVFHIEIGPTRGSDPAGDHAKHFHNRSILPYFPSLSPRVWQLTDIQADVCDGTKVPDIITQRLRPFTTTTFECKTGGIIGGSP